MTADSKKQITDISFLAAIIFFLTAAAAYPREDLWQRLNAEIMKLSREDKYLEAIYVARNSIKLAEKTFGAQDPRVAASMNNLATLYRIVGRYDDAETYYIHSLTIRENALGPQHRHVANSLNNLAGLYRAQGRLEEAELLYLRALKIRKKALGPEHPDVGQSLNNLGLLYKMQTRYDEAEQLYKQALAIWEKKLGPQSPHVATVMENMSELYKTTGKKQLAIEFQTRARKIRSGVNQ